VQVLGKGCGKPLSNCMVMGEFATPMIKQGRAREVSRQDALEIKREAEAHGCVTWIMNVEATKGQAACSCCGCCCHAMRAVSEFNAPGIIAPPHFVPEFDLAKCTLCGKCAKNCPMGAITVDPAARTHRHERVRCIGCGLCVLACDRAKAIAMNAVPDCQMPYKSWFSYLLLTTPGRLRNAWSVSRQRRKGERRQGRRGMHQPGR
jgi:Pyruvate/2-oxoacid:ferredoxin oxidoreductase delta subunit